MRLCGCSQRQQLLQCHSRAASLLPVPQPTGNSYSSRFDHCTARQLHVLQHTCRRAASVLAPKAACSTSSSSSSNSRTFSSLCGQWSPRQLLQPPSAAADTRSSVDSYNQNSSSSSSTTTTTTTTTGHGVGVSRGRGGARGGRHSLHGSSDSNSRGEAASSSGSSSSSRRGRSSSSYRGKGSRQVVIGRHGEGDSSSRRSSSSTRSQALTGSKVRVQGSVVHSFLGCRSRL
jgi:hypothetical protein